MNKLLAILLVFGLVLFGCTSETDEGPKTLEELEAQTGEGSEYAKCLEKIEQNEQDWEDCRLAKLEEVGYTDGLDCIQEYDPICNYICWDQVDISHCFNLSEEEDREACVLDAIETDECSTLERLADERYSADLDAQNECNKIIDKWALTRTDCLQLK